MLIAIVIAAVLVAAVFGIPLVLGSRPRGKAGERARGGDDEAPRG